MYQLIDGIPVWGAHDEATLAQIRRCASDAPVAAAALMADGHKGYSMPIGGVVAYRDAVSPSGVGYDISCLVAGTQVSTNDGYYLPIEQVSAQHPALCWDGKRVRPIEHNHGAIARPTRPVIAVRLMNGRTLTATPDHLVRTNTGWKPAGDLTPADTVACVPYVGLPFGAYATELPLAFDNLWIKEQLAARSLYPLRTESALFPVVLRLLGVISGDGHLNRDGKRISVYTTNDDDAAAIAADFARLGATPRVARRVRHPNRKPELHVYITSTALHALFAALGSPVGKKLWPVEPMPWLFTLPPWMRAHFLSAFCSAEMMRPRILAGQLPNLQIKQAGEDTHAIAFIGRLFESLSFPVSIAPSGAGRGERQDYVLQLLGGGAAQVRFLEEIGFCYAREKRMRGAAAASIYWQHAAGIRHRAAAQVEARQLHAAGSGRKAIVAAIAERYGVAPGFVHHAIYDDRGTPCLPANLFVPTTDGEIAWVPVASVEACGEAPVYDVVTSDPAHAFFASGIVVHNCGIKGVRTSVRADDLRPQITGVMDAIARTVVFGVGQTSGKAADHELFDDPTWSDLPFVGKLQPLAREQLGTVGSGNHFVDLLEDEDGWLWVSTHFGSRGLGHRIASGFLNLAAGRAFDDRAPGEHMDQPATVLPLDRDLGQAYWQAMTLAGRYAYAGRDFVVGQVLDILGAEATEEVHNHHNYCIAGDALVATPKGPKRIDSITSGDEVYAVDSQGERTITVVQSQWLSGEKEILTVKTGSRCIRVSEDHPILTVEVRDQSHPTRPWHQKRSGAYVWKRAGAIKTGDILVCAEGYYEQETTLRPGLARFIGAYLGDGWLRTDPSSQGYTVGLAIGSKTEPHTERYLQLCKELWPDVSWKNNSAGAFGLTCSSKQVWMEIQELGLAQGSTQRRLPTIAFQLSYHERLELLAGYIDADGSVASDTKNHGRCVLGAVNRNLISDVRELAISLGLQITNLNQQERSTNFGDCVITICTLAPTSAQKLPLWHESKSANLHASAADHSRLELSKCGYLEMPRGIFAQRVVSVSRGSAEPVFDLTVMHPDHAFICEGIVVHNCWKESHGGEDVYVVRKGATPAWPGQRGFIGGSMGDISVVVEGVDGDESRAALHSTVHGAGRVMSRTQAAGKRRWVKRNGRRVQEVVKPGQISRAMMEEWLQRVGVELRGAGTDESPHVYRRLQQVLDAHAGSIRVVHTLRPLGVAMAGEEVFDPYKD